MNNPLSATFNCICPSCGSKQWKILFRGYIRDGSYGKMTDDQKTVYQCTGCSLARLGEFIFGSEQYQSSSYRESYNNSIKSDILLKMHDHEQPARIQMIGIDDLRNQIVVDNGCGHGSFLDLVKGIADKTVGIEPFERLHDSLIMRGHSVFSCVEDALREFKNQADVVVSFGVIEHVNEPLYYLKKSFDLLKDGGRLVIQTDNLNDILMVTKAKEFDSFFFRTAHNWYFEPNTLANLVKKAGFNDVEVFTTHSYDFSNFLLWHREGKPTGLGQLSMFEHSFEAVWKATVEQSSYGDLVSCFARK